MYIYKSFTPLGIILNVNNVQAMNPKNVHYIWEKLKRPTPLTPIYPSYSPSNLLGLFNAKFKKNANATYMAFTPSTSRHRTVLYPSQNNQFRQLRFITSEKKLRRLKCHINCVHLLDHIVPLGMINAGNRMIKSLGGRV